MLPLGPNRNAGEAVTGAFEGWFYRPDGSVTLLVGYFNRNMKQVLDIPVGPEQPDRAGRPRLRPADALPAAPAVGRVHDPACRRTSATRSSPGPSSPTARRRAIPLSLHQQYQVEPYEEKGMGNTPPVLRFEPGGAVHTGPPIGVAATLDGIGGEAADAAGVDHRQAGEVRRQRPAAAGGERRARTRAASRSPADVELHRGPGDVTFGKREAGRSTRPPTARRRPRPPSRARRIHPARAGERHLRRGRRRVSVLLDERAREGHRQGRRDPLKSKGGRRASLEFVGAA